MELIKQNNRHLKHALHYDVTNGLIDIPFIREPDAKQILDQKSEEIVLNQIARGIP
jgi:hypothetical protein